MSRRFAADTTVPVERTQAEIGTLLAKHGATARASGVDDTTGRATVMFALAGRRIRVEVPLHPITETTPRGWWAWTEAKKRTWMASNRQQRERATWRASCCCSGPSLRQWKAGTRRSSASFSPTFPRGSCHKRCHSAAQDRPAGVGPWRAVPWSGGPPPGPSRGPLRAFGPRPTPARPARAQ